MKSYDLDALTSGERYRLISGCITPRPIALVSTIDPEGRTNIAPFSFFNAMGCDPIIFVFSPLTEVRDGKEHLKDTLRNVLPEDQGGTAEMVIHLAVESNLRAMAACAANLEREQSEFDFAGLTPIPSLKVKPPRIAESPMAFECRTLQVVRTAPGRSLSGNIVIAQAVHAWVDGALVDDALHVDQSALRTLGRLGGPNYVSTRTYFSFPRGAEALEAPLPDFSPDEKQPERR